MRVFPRFLRIVLLGLAAQCAVSSASEGDGFSTEPRLNGDHKWRIAYYEGGPHTNYYYYLVATVKGLMRLGWIENTALPDSTDKSTEDIWNWLAASVKSDYLEFVKDAYYTVNWNASKQEAMRDKIIARLNGEKDIDLIIAMGTWAGKDIANDRHSVPTMVMSTSDPVNAGIIDSVADSGHDHIHARVDPGRYERQLRIFHDIIGFKKLGVAYEDSFYGRTYAAIEPIEKVAAERGFEVVKCYTQSDIADQQVAGESVKNCFQQLVKQADAIYVTMQGGVNDNTIAELVQIANENHTPTFSQFGSEEVKAGFLLSISRAGGFRPVGTFLAATMGKIFNGAQPRRLSQVFEDAPNIAINLKTAERIGLYLYADVLAAADEIFREIESP